MIKTLIKAVYVVRTLCCLKVQEGIPLLTM